MGGIALIIVGLCGGSGSGKGAVCSFFEEYGTPTIDTDAVYHDLTSRDSECLRELVAEFGESIVVGGVLNRRVLAQIVFCGEGAENRHRRLNTIAHKHILNEVRAKIADYESEGYKAVVVDAPLLFESGFNEECDVVVSVIADAEIRINRIISRDNISRSDAIQRIKSQKSDDWLRDRSDFVVVNNGGLEALKSSVSSILNEILS